eukprot:scaffold9139_cov64-Phaeocystis_antarctica.AAC.6
MSQWGLLATCGLLAVYGPSPGQPADYAAAQLPPPRGNTPTVGRLLVGAGPGQPACQGLCPAPA